MSVNNNGNQKITFPYKCPAQADEFNELIQGLNNTGVYSGFQINKDTNTNVIIGPGYAVISDGTMSVKVETTQATNQPVTVTSSATPYVVMRWQYQYTENNFADFLAVSSPSANDIVLGRLKFVGSTIVGIDYSYRSFANILEENVIISNTYNTPNELALNPATNFWYIDNDGYTIEYKNITQKTTIQTLSVTDTYYIYYNGTTYGTLTSVTGLTYSFEKCGWYDSSYRKILAKISYNNGTTTITPEVIYNSPQSTYFVDDTKIPLTYLDTDGTLSADSDTKIATQKATVTYVKNKAIAYALVFG